MKALRFSQTGSLDDLALTDVDTPTAGEGEVLVRVEAAGVNPSDLKNLFGRYPFTTVPRVPGRDLAGIVEEGPAHLKGKAIWASPQGVGYTRDGSHAEYVVVPVEAVALKPEALSFAQAAAVGVPWITAWEGVERSGITAGTNVLVIGASGAVGQAMVQLAVARGARVLGAVRREAQLAEVPAGAEPLLLGEPDTFPERLKAQCAEGAEVVVDTTGFWLAPAVEVLARHGRIVAISAPPSGTTDMPILAFYRQSGTLVGVNSLLRSSAECGEMLTHIGTLFDSGDLPMPAAPNEWALADGPKAYRALDAGGAGKIVLIP